MARRKRGKGKRRGCSFSELERKFAQLNGARCLPLVPLIVVESTTRAESRNKGNTSRAFVHLPVPLPGAYNSHSPREFEAESISPRNRHLFSLPRFLLVALWGMYIFYIIWLREDYVGQDISPLPSINEDYIDCERNCIWSIVDLLGAFPRHLEEY